MDAMPTDARGPLPDTIRTEAAALLTERGPAAFSVREVARRAGVTHTAVNHHYGSAEGVLTAVAVEALQHLTTATERAIATVDDPADAFVALGRAYVQVAVDHPGHCAVAFRADLVDADDPAYQEWGERAYGVLFDTVAALLADDDPARIATAASLAWASMEGLIGMYEPITKTAAHRGLPPAPIDELADRFSRLLISGLLAER